MNSGSFWVLRIYELMPDCLGAAPGAKWVFSPRDHGGSQYVVCDEDTDATVERYSSLVEALDAAMSPMTGRGQITLSRAMLSDNGVRWGEQHVLASLDEWRHGNSFVTAEGIGQTKDRFVQYLQAVLTSQPPIPRRGAVLLLMSIVPLVDVLLVGVLVFQSWPHLPWSYFAATLMLALAWGFVTLCRGEVFLRPSGQMVQIVLGLACLGVNAWAFWRYGWKIGLVEVFVISVGATTGRSIVTGLIHR